MADGEWKAEKGEWSADVDTDLVADLAKDLVKDVCYTAPTDPVRRIHLGLAHLLAGLGLLHGGGVYRHVARKHIELYFDIIFGRLN